MLRAIIKGVSIAVFLVIVVAVFSSLMSACSKERPQTPEQVAADEKAECARYVAQAAPMNFEPIKCNNTMASNSNWYRSSAFVRLKGTSRCYLLAGYGNNRTFSKEDCEGL